MPHSDIELSKIPARFSFYNSLPHSLQLASTFFSIRHSQRKRPGDSLPGPMQLSALIKFLGLRVFVSLRVIGIASPPQRDELSSS